jgi:hypothetical protein
VKPIWENRAKFSQANINLLENRGAYMFGHVFGHERHGCMTEKGKQELVEGGMKIDGNDWA